MDLYTCTCAGFKILLRQPFCFSLSPKTFKHTSSIFFIFHFISSLSAFLFPSLSPATLILLHSPIYDHHSVAMLSLFHIYLHLFLFFPFNAYDSPPPISQYINSRAPVSCLLLLRISSLCSRLAPAHCPPLAPLLIYHLFVSDLLE